MMANSSGILRRSRGLAFHSCVSFVVVVLLSSYMTEAQSTNRTHPRLLGKLISVSENENSPEKIDVPSHRGNTTMARSYTDESSTITNAVAEKPAPSDPLLPFMNSVTGPLDEDDLEYSLDYYKEKALMKEYDFEPTDCIKRLANSAMAEGTTPSQFLQEIQDLLSLQNRSRSEQDVTTSRDDVSKLPAGYLSESLLKKMTEGWKNELKRLEKKYNISSECTGPESITSTRLALMFPHYINFDQKPFSAPSNITVGFNTGQRIEICDDGCRYEYPDLNVPSILGRPEFGGVIPLVLLNKPTRCQIIGVHLYALHRNDTDDMVPFRTKCGMLKRRMEKSLLSEERRFRFLINNEIMHKNGTLLRTSIKNVYEKIPRTFKDKIDWDLLSWEVQV